MHRLVSLGVFLMIVVLAVAVGGQFIGGEWYQQVNQPAWNPPAMVMALAWAIAYVLMAVSAWMIWEEERGLAVIPLGLWGLQLLLGVCWSWMYFGLHRPGWAMGVMTLWMVVVLLVVKVFRPVKIEASSLMMPVAAWMLFSWVLSLAQWNMNGGGLGSIF